MKKASFLILAIIVLIMASLSIRSAYCDESKIIEVQNIEIKKLPAEHNFIGINWSNASKNRPIFDNQTYRDELTDVLKTLGTDIVRYPGGQNILTNFWNITDEDVLTALRKLPAQDREWINPSATATKNIDFISFIKFCENSSIKAEVQVNTHNYFDEENKEIKYLKNYERDSNGQRIFNTGKIDWELVQKAANSAAEQVKWVKLNGNSKIVNYWELGNEDYHKLKMNCAYTGTEYGKVAGIFLKTMVSADPSIKVIITNNDWIQNWSKDVMSDPDVRKYRKNIYAVSNHIYGYGKTEKDFSYYAFKKNILTNPELDLQNRLNFHKTLLKDTDFADTKIFLNEFNSGFYLDPFIQTWLGAIGDSEMILSCANMPSCSHADFHELFMNWCGSDDIYENKGFGLVHFAKDFTKPFLIKPEGTVISLLNESIKGYVLKTIFNNQEIYAVSTSNNGLIKVILLNKEKDRSVYIKLSDFPEIKYIKNQSIGIDVPEKFTIMDSGDSCSNPNEIRQLNILNNALTLNFKSGKYSINLPANTLSVFTFKKVN